MHSWINWNYLSYSCQFPLHSQFPGLHGGPRFHRHIDRSLKEPICLARRRWPGVGLGDVRHVVGIVQLRPQECFFVFWFRHDRGQSLAVGGLHDSHCHPHGHLPDVLPRAGTDHPSSSWELDTWQARFWNKYNKDPYITIRVTLNGIYLSLYTVST